MNNFLYQRDNQFSFIEKLIMKAKIALTLIIISTSVVMAEKAYSQTAKVTIEAGDKSIELLMDEIEKQSEFYFIFNQTQIDVNRIVNISANNELIENVLPKLFAGTDVKHVIMDRKILLTNDTEENIISELTQQRVVTGTIVDSNGEPLPGVNVTIMGTTIGVMTDIDGNYSINVPVGDAIIQFSCIGFSSQETVAGNKSLINITLAEDTQMLDEVVVIGYGVQAKKDITGSVSVVTAEALAESTSVTFAEALQGKSAGVYVSTTGAPGSSSTIRVRGVGSVNGSDPLVIIDGVSGGNINSVNSNDIETFQVLKDASATAIYGAQGANGVIIITTKQGTKSGQASVSYNGYFGISTMSNSGYDLLNGWEMMEFIADGQRNQHNYRDVAMPAGNAQFGSLQGYDIDPVTGNWIGGQLTMPYSINPAGQSLTDIITAYGSVEAWEAAYGEDGGNSHARSAYYQILLDKGYDVNNPSFDFSTVLESDLIEAKAGSQWYDMIVQKGFIQDHQLSVIGGNDKGQYSISFSYTGQEGTVKSSFFDRYSLRVNSTFYPRKFITIGLNSDISVTESQGDRGSQGDGSVFGQTYTMKQWVPVYNVGGGYAGSTANEGGRMSSAFATVNRQKGDWSRNANTQNSIFLEVKPIPELTLKTQAVARLRGSWSRTFNELTRMDNSEGSTRNSLRESGSWNLDLQWTNTATYTKKIQDHNLTVVVGSEALDQGYGRDIDATRYDYTYPDLENTWVIDNGSTVDLGNGGGQGSHTSMFGYFGRTDYSFKGKYLATVTVRRDASSKFSEDNRWGTFPSVSLGWRISDESFMDGASGWLNDFKFRAGYGTTGNSNIGSYNWAYQYATGTNYHYAFDGSDNAASTGYAVSALGDSDAKWETTRMFNIGFDASALDNRLTIGFDYYIKKTTDMLVTASFSSQAGSATKPNVNVGDMQNNGIDLQIGWSDQIGKFKYGITANLSQYKNEVIKLGSSDLFNSTRITNIKITTPGQPIGMFYGYNVLGIYQSDDDVLNFLTDDGSTILPYGINDIGDLNPTSFIGRYKFEDVNGDGKISDLDATIIGNPHPDFTGGLNLTASYGNWDFSSYLYFSVGNDIYRMYMYYTHFGSLGSNYVKDRRDNSWTPDNPDGVYPMWLGPSSEAKETTTVSTSSYIDDGSYLRMQTISLGYSLPKSAMDKIGVSKLRVYGQVSNPFTFTKYTGLDPEVNSTNDRTRGIDYGAYGMPRQFIMGVNLTF